MPVTRICFWKTLLLIRFSFFFFRSSQGWVADRAWLCSQPVDLGEGLQAQGAGRKADREVYLRVRESVVRAPDH